MIIEQKKPHKIKWTRNDIASIQLDGMGISQGLVDVKIKTLQGKFNIIYSEVSLIFDSNSVYTDENNRVFINGLEMLDFEYINLSPVFLESERELVTINIIALVNIEK